MQVAPMVDTGTVAKFLGITQNALAKMRMDGNGPQFVRVGPRTIRYEWAEVERWVADNRRASTGEYTQT